MGMNRDLGYAYFGLLFGVGGRGGGRGKVERGGGTAFPPLINIK